MTKLRYNKKKKLFYQKEFPMNNNYEYVEKLKENKEEQKKIEEQLQKELDILLISEEEKEKLLLSVIKNAIDSYTPTTLLN